jgi:hypothetical protein
MSRLLIYESLSFISAESLALAWLIAGDPVGQLTLQTCAYYDPELA